MSRYATFTLMLACVALIAALGTASLARGQGATPTPFVEPGGCLRPPDDYTRLWVNGALLNARTVAMLDQAQALYNTWGGTQVNFRLAITQGSYNPGGVAASFGTHDGGGAVDISVRSLADWSVMTDEIPAMIRALRVAGFAAWLRDTDELYPGSIIHIHAIAVGDQEHAEAARAQIDGPFGYLRGFNGLPTVSGIPLPDRHGGPVLCQWMIDAGFRDLRGQPVPFPTPGGTTQPFPHLP